MSDVSGPTMADVISACSGGGSKVGTKGGHRDEAK